MSASFHDKMKTLDWYISIIAAPLFHNFYRDLGYVSHFKIDTFPLLFLLAQFKAVPLQFITDFLYFQHVSVVYYNKNFLLAIFIKRFHESFFKYYKDNISDFANLLNTTLESSKYQVNLKNLFTPFQQGLWLPNLDSRVGKKCCLQS